MNQRIRELRKALGLSGAKFGERLGVAKSSISNIENGGRDVTNQMFKAICREFNVNEHWLRTGEGEMFADEDIDFGAVCAKIGITDERAKKLIVGYYNLSPQDKELIWSFLEKLKKITE